MIDEISNYKELFYIVQIVSFPFSHSSISSVFLLLFSVSWSIKLIVVTIQAISVFLPAVALKVGLNARTLGDTLVQSEDLRKLRLDLRDGTRKRKAQLHNCQVQ